MAPCLSRLPHLCLDAIFKHIPLVDLLNFVGPVCKSFYKARLRELKKRRHLMLVQRQRGQLEVINSNFIYCSNGTDLIRHVRRDDGSPWFTVESVAQMKFDLLFAPDGKMTFPFISSLMVLSKVTHLSLMFLTVPSSALTQVVRLIDHFAEHLVDLKLSFVRFCDHDSDSEDNAAETEVELVHNVANLFACLDRLQKLRHLKLGLDMPFHLRPELSFLSRLTTFGIFAGGDDRVDWILSSLLQYEDNIKLIELHNVVDLQDLLHVGHQLGTKFNVLYLIQIGTQEYDDMKLFCTRFSSLTKLSLSNCSMPMTMLARCLSRLHQLVNLDLHVMNVQLEVGEEQPPQEIVQVPSVRLLVLSFITKSHVDSERLFIPEIFPNLQVLSLSHCIRGCPDCHIKLGNGSRVYRIEGSKPSFVRRLAKCTRRARQPFRRCLNLRTIQIEDSYVANEPRMITANEL